MKILVGVITAIVIWLIYLTLEFRELRLENQKRDDAALKINNAVMSLVNEKNSKERTTENYKDIVKVEDASKAAFHQSKARDLENNHPFWHETNTAASIKIHTDRSMGSIPKRFSYSAIKPTLPRSNKNRITRSSVLQSRGNKVQNEQVEVDTATKCILLENNTLDAHSVDMVFNVTMNLMTDRNDHEISWKLIQQDHSIPVIDSITDITNLSPNALHEFEYKCFVSPLDENHVNPKNKVCFDFRIYDPIIWNSGFCCEYGLGYFELSINENPISFGSNRLQGMELASSFCINSENGILFQDEPKSTKASVYPSRECKSNECLCDANPPALTSLDHDNMYDIKMNVLTNMILLSGSENLNDVTSPQYKAACWTLNDDPYEYNGQIDAPLKKNIEGRMLQRYIMAIFYFATKPDGWKFHYHYLSSRSECMWNSVEEFYNNEQPLIGGCLCDDDENIFSVFFKNNNLDGTLINEISGLDKLEELFIHTERKMRGTIPSVLGRLSNLEQLELLFSSFEGTIPPHLFNATRLQNLDLGANRLSGTIPKSIGQLQTLSYLSFYKNNIRGTIPEEIYSLESLVLLMLPRNNLSGSISNHISNLKNIEWISLDKNELTGTVPSTIDQLPRLVILALDNNKLEGEINISPSMTNLGYIGLHNNEIRGSISEEACEIESLKSDSNTVKNKFGFDFWGITSDCKNDILAPNVKCTCCSYCFDKTPFWDSKCADKTIKIKFHHKILDRASNSDDLVWSLVENSSGNPVMYDGRYDRVAFSNDKEAYEACASSTGCYSLMMYHPPLEDTNYTIFLNDKSVYNGTFESHASNNSTDLSVNGVVTTSFYYDEDENEVIFDTPCPEKEIVCFGKSIHLNTKQRVMYNTAMKLSGSSTLSNETSVHSKALCWIVSNDSQYYGTTRETLGLIFTQRYVLTLLHLLSVNGLFGGDEFPHESHECDGWTGIECNDKNIMTTLSLPNMEQMIDGTLIDEIGSLPFLEILEMSHSKLEGSIPETFSNLYSLKEFNLSYNSLTGSISDHFFKQMKTIELIDISNNDMSGEIPTSIGLNSNIKEIWLGNNRFTGPLPLDSFKKFNLKYLDVSENQLSGSISPSLLEHRNLEHLGLGRNFFVGILEESIFDDLTKLKYFNVSKNELTGTIPSFHDNESNITQFDVHANRFTGTLPNLLGMLAVEFLNLQGNEITGSIPFELNDLVNLHTLVLSHNKFKGSIPISFEKLSNLSNLFLHANELYGEAPIANKKMDGYITDCGYPSVSLDTINCPSCGVCCNSENVCSRQRKSILEPTLIAAIFFLFLIGFMGIIYVSKERIVDSVSVFENHVMYWQASTMIGEKSVYHFFLTHSTQGWYVGLFCAVAQLATLFLFINAADIANEGSDLQYTLTCSANSLECDDEKSTTPFGGVIFSLILGTWLLKDIVGSIKLFMVAMWKQDIDFFFASMILFLVTSLSAWTSVYYNLAIATKDTELIVNAVILLFVNELDERLFQLVNTCNFSWTDDVDECLLRESFHEGQKLNVFRAVNKVKKRFHNLSSSVSSSIIPRGRANPKEVVLHEENQKDNFAVSEDSVDLDIDLGRDSTISERDFSASILNSVNQE